MERLVARTDTPEDYLLRLRAKGDKRSDPDGKRFGRLKERLWPASSKWSNPNVRIGLGFERRSADDNS